MRRMALTLRYYAEHESMEERVARYRKAGVHIGERVVIYDSMLDPVYPSLITIGDDCTITGAQLLCHDDSLILFKKRARAAPVTIGSRVFIGRGAILLPGVEVGSDVIVGAGSVVRGTIPSRSIAVGNPARVVMPLEEFLLRRETDPSVLGPNVPSNQVEDPALVAELRLDATRRWSMERPEER